MNGQTLEEKLSRPIEEVLFHLGRGIALAQMELDRQSIYIQTLINQNPELKDMGLEATWYQIPEAVIDLKISIHIVEEVKNSIKKRRLFLSPMNASYKNSFNYEVSSSINIRVVPVPPSQTFEGE